MAPTKEKTRRRAAKLLQGFERNPARCINCNQFDPPAHAVAGRLPYKPARCRIGGFGVEAHSICDQWTGRAGETLEP